jgi:hypothetical protein
MFNHLPQEEHDRLLDIVRAIKKKFPTSYPLRIITKDKLPGLYGKAQFIEGKKPYFLITLRREPFEMLLETYIHEVGHCLAWKVGYNSGDTESFHDESWAIEYGRIYRWLHESEESPLYKAESHAARCS